MCTFSFVMWPSLSPSTIVESLIKSDWVVLAEQVFLVE